jgi:hypothetical protein
MESKKLIEAVKQRPTLFERNRKSYKDAERKSRARGKKLQQNWESIVS